VDTDVSGVLHKAQNYIHLGAELMSPQLASDHSSGENPYISLVVLELEDHVGVTTDFYSLTLIEDAIKELKATALGFDGHDDSALKGFQAADLELLKDCLDKFD